MMLAIILVAVALTNSSPVQEPTGNQSHNIVTPTPDNNEGKNEPVITTPEGMSMPLAKVSVLNDYCGESEFTAP